jgi:hypothetical protein
MVPAWVSPLMSVLMLHVDESGDNCAAVVPSVGPHLVPARRKSDIRKQPQTLCQSLAKRNLPSLGLSRTSRRRRPPASQQMSRMSSSHTRLLWPLILRGQTLPNRIVFGPHTANMAEDGHRVIIVTPNACVGKALTRTADDGSARARRAKPGAVSLPKALTSNGWYTGAAHGWYRCRTRRTG